MIVDLGVGEMSKLLENRDKLNKVVDEAYEVENKIILMINNNLFFNYLIFGFTHFRCFKINRKGDIGKKIGK